MIVNSTERINKYLAKHKKILIEDLAMEKIGDLDFEGSDQAVTTVIERIDSGDLYGDDDENLDWEIGYVAGYENALRDLLLKNNHTELTEYI